MKQEFAISHDDSEPRRFFFGPLGSLFLHALAALFLFYSMNAPLVPPDALRILPVEFIILARETISPPAPRINAAPQQPRASAPLPIAPPIPDLAPAIPNAPTGEEPTKIETPTDALQTQLDALAKLVQPGSGVSDKAASSDGAARGPQATYSVRDYVRAQVVRHWNLNLDLLGSRNVTIAIHVVLKRDGTIVTADVVNLDSYREDETIYSIALSARNAVLLSSPITLPPGLPDDAMDMVLNLNPRDALR